VTSSWSFILQLSLIGIWTYNECNFSAPTPSQPVYLSFLMLDTHFIRTYGLTRRMNEADQVLSLLEK